MVLTQKTNMGIQANAEFYKDDIFSFEFER